ncbi:MAG TPA: hypothetical protein VL199_15110 [Burkholderiales bacterium]|jgi:hypothetical protein|nr:hypothetical protein [Burkholderiales bacterium]
MKAMLIAGALAGALYGAGAIAGEDTTDRYGQGGTGAPWYVTDCGLTRFPGPRGNRDDRRPCGRRGLAYDENGKLIPNAPVSEKNTPPAPSTADKPQR